MDCRMCSGNHAYGRSHWPRGDSGTIPLSPAGVSGVSGLGKSSRRDGDCGEVGHGGDLLGVDGVSLGGREVDMVATR
jgi:hypothetical protein